MKILKNHSLKNYNTFGINVNAKLFTKVHSIDDFKKISKTKEFRDNKILLLGSGSNILFIKDFDGLVVKDEIKGIEIVTENKDYIWIKAGGGEDWNDFVNYCVDNNYAGIENLSLIPGTVGAAPIQNIGAYGVELKDIFEQLEAINLKNTSISIFKKKDCKFGYRDSVFKNKLKGKYFISSVTLRLNKKPVFKTSYGAIEDTLKDLDLKKNIKNISSVVSKIRESKLPYPKEIANAGSFFKNPVVDEKKFNDLMKRYPSIPNFKTGKSIKVSAAWFIEKCGWKGKRIGNIGVHDKQALVLVNYGNAGGKEIKKLAEDIVESVKSKFGIILNLEVSIV